eukprot:g2592.t1
MDPSAITFANVNFEMGTGSEGLPNNPPVPYIMSSYVEESFAGNETTAELSITGSMTFLLLDRLYFYNHSNYPVGVGSTTNYDDVEFKDTTDGGLPPITITFESFVAYLTMVADDYIVQMVLSDEDFTVDGHSLSNDETKFDLRFTDMESTSDSCGIQTMAVSVSIDETISIDVPDDIENDPNQETETFGAAYLSTSKTVQGGMALSSYTDGNTFSVVEGKQLMTSDNCGFASSHWFNSAVTDGDVTYADAGEWFEAVNFGDQYCMFFSFQLDNATLTEIWWDPIFGIDEEAAQSAARGGGKLIEFGKFRRQFG